MGTYLPSLTKYVDVNSAIITNLDLANWFDANNYFNVGTLRNLESKTPIVRFVDGGQSFQDDQDIVVFDIERVGYGIPPKQLQVAYRKNHTIQTQEQLAGVTTQEEKEKYKLDYKRDTRYLNCNRNLYINQVSVEYATGIYNQPDAERESQAWLAQRNKLIDHINVTCPILSANADVILGVIVDAEGTYVNISDTQLLISNTTYLISNNNSAYSGQKTLQVGDVVQLDSFHFNYQDDLFVIYSISINTKKMQVTYELVGQREISTCNQNVVYNGNNIVHNGNNVVHNL